MDTNRYFRTDRGTLNRLGRIQTPRWEQVSRNHQVARAVGLSEDELREADNMRISALDYAVNERGVGFLQEASRNNINGDAGAGWAAVTIGEERGPAVDLGVHVSDLNDLQQEFLALLARREGIELDLSDYAAAREGARI